MTVRVLSALLLLAPVLAGCSTERHTLAGDCRNQVVRVESGDRFFMDLEENAAAGCRWSARCDDSDVEVRVDHESGRPGKAKVLIRIHRGYDGPSAVTFLYRRPPERKPLKQFTVTLFKRTGDCAFWK